MSLNQSDKYIMPNKNNAVDEFLNQVNEGNENLPEPDKDPFANVKVEQEVGAQADANADGTKKDEGDKPEKPLPFHQNPKVRRYIEKEVERLTKHLTPSQASDFREKVGEDNDLVGAFTAIIGNDTPEKVNALKMLKDTLDGIKSEARQGIEIREAEVRAENEAREELKQGFDDIEETFDVDLTSSDPVARKTRAEFIDFIKRVAPKNDQGEITAYPDFQETFTLFQEFKKKPATPSRAKELASRSMERSSDASAPQAPTDTSWKGVDKFFSTLKG